jgi:hypothetical protein
VDYGLRLIRNQQVAGSIPAGGFSFILFGEISELAHCRSLADHLSFWLTANLTAR